jgi:hypothetical protein
MNCHINRNIKTGYLGSKKKRAQLQIREQSTFTFITSRPSNQFNVILINKLRYHKKKKLVGVENRLTLPSGLLFILSRTLSKAGFPVVSPRAAIRSALRGFSNAPTAEPTATAACCHRLSWMRPPSIILTILSHCQILTNPKQK